MVDDSRIQMIINRAMDLGCSFAEVFAENRDDISIDFDKTLKSVSSMRTCGLGIYLFSGLKSVYVYTNNLEEKSLLDFVTEAVNTLGVKGSPSGVPYSFKTDIPQIPNPCQVLIYPSDATIDERIQIIREADFKARKTTASVKDIDLTYFDRDQRVIIANSEGLYAQDRRITTRLRFIPIITSNDKTTSSFFDYCSSSGLEALKNSEYLPSMRESLLDMEAGLSAKKSPSGRKTVILEGGSCSGTFFHEACGHQLETNALEKGGLFWDKRSQRVASEKVTLIDDGSMPNQYGSSRFDDEGFPRQKNILIDKGILKSFLVDRRGGLLLGLQRTGSGRRQDYAHAPAARMSNTYLAPGNDDEDQMIRDTEDGIFVTSLGGGTGGDVFSLMATVAFEIKNGEIKDRIKGAMLTGRGDETMLKIDRVGKKMIFEQGGGSFCGADSGFCATTTSGPRMRITDMLIGGEA